MFYESWFNSYSCHFISGLKEKCDFQRIVISASLDCLSENDQLIYGNAANSFNINYKFASLYTVELIMGHHASSYLCCTC